MLQKVMFMQKLNSKHAICVTEFKSFKASGSSVKRDSEEMSQGREIVFYYFTTFQRRRKTF